MYKAMGDRLPGDADLILASGDHRVGALAFGPTTERTERITPWGDGPAPGEERTIAGLAEAAERAPNVEERTETLRAHLRGVSSLGGARPTAPASRGQTNKKQ